MFPCRLKSLRKSEGLSQESISLKLGVARTTYSGYERGTSEPDLETLNKIADHFEVTVDYLIGRSNHKEMYFNNEIEKTIYDILDLSDDEIIDKVPMTYDGLVLTVDEKREFIAIARGIFAARKSLKEARHT